MQLRSGRVVSNNHFIINTKYKNAVIGLVNYIINAGGKLSMLEVKMYIDGLLQTPTFREIIGYMLKYKYVKLTDDYLYVL